MLRLPARFAAVILCFAPLFRQHTWRHAQVLLIGAILGPGQRTVTSILRIGGVRWVGRVFTELLRTPPRGLDPPGAQDAGFDNRPLAGDAALGHRSPATGPHPQAIDNP